MARTAQEILVDLDASRDQAARDGDRSAELARNRALWREAEEAGCDADLVDLANP